MCWGLHLKVLHLWHSSGPLISHTIWLQICSSLDSDSVPRMLRLRGQHANPEPLLLVWIREKRIFQTSDTYWMLLLGKTILHEHVIHSELHCSCMIIHATVSMALSTPSCLSLRCINHIKWRHTSFNDTQQGSFFSTCSAFTLYASVDNVQILIGYPNLREYPLVTSRRADSIVKIIEAGSTGSSGGWLLQHLNALCAFLQGFNPFTTGPAQSLIAGWAVMCYLDSKECLFESAGTLNQVRVVVLPRHDIH